MKQEPRSNGNPNANKSGDLIFGKNPVREVLRSGRRIHRLMLAEHFKGPIEAEIVRLADERGLSVERMPVAEMTRLVKHRRHQGVVAETEAFRYAALADILRTAEARQEPPLVVLLDRVEDPHNLGAIIRSAEAAAVHGIIIPKDQAARVSPVVEKSAAGATAYVPVVQVTNLARTMDELKKQGLWLFGADQAEGQPLDEVDFSGPAGILLGGEGKGMRRLVRESCDFLVRIPMYGKIDSLNVSVAAGVLFFEARRQRERQKKPKS